MSWRGNSLLRKMKNNKRRERLFGGQKKKQELGLCMRFTQPVTKRYRNKRPKEVKSWKKR